MNDLMMMMMTMMMPDDENYIRVGPPSSATLIRTIYRMSNNPEIRVQCSGSYIFAIFESLIHTFVSA